MPHSKSGAYVYNENLMKTFESSEFEGSPEQLPGMIFGLGQQPNGRGSIPASKARDSTTLKNLAVTHSPLDS